MSSGQLRQIELHFVLADGRAVDQTWRTPLGSSSVRRSPLAGRSRTRFWGPGPTVAGSKTHTSAK